MEVGDDDDVVLRRWFETCHGCGVRLVAASAMAERLHAAYTEPHRRYHDLGHIRHVLDLVATLRLDPQVRTEVELCLWFHDLVYDPVRADNEARSADIARSWLGEQGIDVASRVADLVLTTENHEVDRRDRAAAVVHDVDLAILGSMPEEYRRYVDAIRAEYGWLDDESFRRGRADVLRRFLAVDPLYLTPELAPVLEIRARANLAAELADLTER